MSAYSDLPRDVQRELESGIVGMGAARDALSLLILSGETRSRDLGLRIYKALPSLGLRGAPALGYAARVTLYHAGRAPYPSAPGKLDRGLIPLVEQRAEELARRLGIHKRSANQPGANPPADSAPASAANIPAATAAGNVVVPTARTPHRR